MNILENYLIILINFRGWVLPKTCQWSDLGCRCSKDFHIDEEAADVNWGKRERGGGGGQGNGAKQERMNRRMKEILIWSERVLIFFSGLAMWAQPVISLETKEVECAEICHVCVPVCMLCWAVCMLFFSVGICVAWVASHVYEVNVCTYKGLDIGLVYGPAWFGASGWLEMLGLGRD